MIELGVKHRRYFAATCMLPVILFMVAVLIPSLVLELVWQYFKATRFAKWLGHRIREASKVSSKYILKNELDAPLLPALLAIVVFYPTIFLMSLWFQVLRPGAVFSWWAVWLYHILRVGPYLRHFAHAATLIHKEGHERGFLKCNVRIIEWFVAFFCGHIPELWALGHTKIHHIEDNGLADPTSTLFYKDRSDVWNFFQYMGQFYMYWCGWDIYYYFVRKNKLMFAQGMLNGIIAFYGIMLLLIAIDVRFALAYYIFPHLEISVYLSAINWAWHCFIDPDDPDNGYVKSLTILKGHYDVWQEDFHAMHHMRTKKHWSNANKDYLEYFQEFVDNQATIFEDTQEFEIFIRVIARDFEYLAAHFVDGSGKLSKEDKVLLMKKRLGYKDSPSSSTA